ncbi:MAG: invasion associated locus B family protein [Pseudomonadota bacterium]|nr:invasion associated locus B family protein [Pseudomonadota bacterium]
MSSFLLHRFCPVAVLAVALALAVPALAAEAQPLGAHKDWSSWMFEEKEGKVCFMQTKPRKSEGKYTRRGDVYLQVTHRPAEGSFDVVSLTAGYSFKPGSDLSVKIDGRSFTLLTSGERAWALDEAGDRQLTDAILKGKQMVVKGVSSRGTETTDTYSLSGSTAAHKAIDKACR